jgi:acetylornithine deacetylase
MDDGFSGDGGAAALAEKLVSIPSISGEEGAVSAFLADFLSEAGFSVNKKGNSIYFETGKGGKKLVFSSHMDTVPQCPGWSMGALSPKVLGGRLYGLGANDAKGPLAAMVACAREIANSDLGGTAAFAFTCEEESTNAGIAALAPLIGKPDAAVFGEPTALAICPAMRGMCILRLTARGKSAHSSRPEQGKNAIYEAMEDIEKLKGMHLGGAHPLLANATLAVTKINAGKANNVIPGECEFVVNMRTTPEFDNRAAIDEVKKCVKSDVYVISDRFRPKETPQDSRIVRAAMGAVPGAKISGMLGACDWAFVDAPAIVFGPGSPAQSHAPDESIDIAEIGKAARHYAAIAKAFFKE